MHREESFPRRALDEAAALRTIVEATATETGERFFAELVRHLAHALDTHGAWVTEYLEERRTLRALAFWMGGDWVQGYETRIDGTPCEAVVVERRLLHLPDNMLQLYPDDPDIKNNGAVSYMGVPLLDVDDRVLGHLAVMDTRPLPADPRITAVFRIFAGRAAAELRRLRAEQELREREEKLGRLISSAMDAIVEIDDAWRVTLLNTAAETLLASEGGAIVGQDVRRFLAVESGGKLGELVAELDARRDGRRSLWIPGGLEAIRGEGPPVAVEATLSRFDMRRRSFHTLILRDVNERLEAERRIRSLTDEAQYLRDELRRLHGGDLLGRSEAMLRMLRDLEQVADTDATVLIVGETGTGKELVARTLHAASRRKDRALVTVNCAAVPAALMESEFFGHEAGAFTGATRRREGLFALADGGTIFLDEVGELPVDLQAKLLRVLQEGEFAPVGNSRPRKVDVRVLAATNRDLTEEVRAGRFREDLYYRLYVFPLPVPPLRERGDDVVLLAQAFADRAAKRMGRSLQPLADASLERLRAYSWPGNVRELQNVIERAVITARDGRLDLSATLPGVAEGSRAAPSAGDGDSIRTMRELEQLERNNIVRALEATGWRVAGKGGAAERLDMPPSTLSSRIKALGIVRPR
jgi:PAS domain S-box-containing protein